MTEYPNWFVSSQPNFEKHLSSYKGKPDLKFLQLGVFTGDASIWMLDNILTDESSSLTDVDTWAGSNEDAHKDMDFHDVWQTYLHRVKDYKNVYPSRLSTEHFFNEHQDDGDWWYDFIYIDADHTAAGVITDAILGWQHLKSGGIMAFDDFTWEHKDGMVYMPFRAIDFFCWAFQFKLEVIEMNNQVWIRKL